MCKFTSISVIINEMFLFEQGINCDLPVQNGHDRDMGVLSQGVNELTFEEDEEDQFYIKDLPKHACT